MLKGNKGITLVALVVTIIVLLILAGVTISLVLGQNGILNQANDAQKASDKAYAKDVVESALKGLEVNKRVNNVDYNDADLNAALPDTFDVSNTEEVVYNAKDNVNYTITIDTTNYVVNEITE